MTVTVECPNSSFTVTMSMPFLVKRDAMVCLKVCQDLVYDVAIHAIYFCFPVSYVLHRYCF